MTKLPGLLTMLALACMLPACATTDAETATPEQRAACEQMLAGMGESAPHSHSTDKGGGVSAMGMTHAQCRRILGR